MSMSDLAQMTKIEVVVGSDDVAEVSALMQSLGARGYTAITGVAGVGHHGHRGGRLLFNDHDTLTLLVTVVAPERADAIVTGIRPFLDQASGVMFVSHTAVSRPDYFA
ncbi:transcriptional regulator [Microbacterium sp. KSW4-11]|uniref:Transcriptional regulator n=1 Tax=Microbacterium gawkjiense TaxID=3067309 RepID=A0ABU3GEB6_9MICO|nr:transcriptional regulator [Microbacterium sp. KSW4-11]MDT3318144.1 transcriptional regulator [Microbacterium sp. KSW4-11]